mgnify:CR=1 FL=1
MKRRIGMLAAACVCILLSVGAFYAGRDRAIPSKPDRTNQETDAEKQAKLPSGQEEEKRTETQDPKCTDSTSDDGTETEKKQQTETSEAASKPDTGQADKISVQPVQTGDDTPVLFFCLLFACSAGILIKKGILNGRNKRDGTGNSAGK